MRVVVILISLVFIALASAQPRVVGHVSQEDVRMITATIRAVTQDRIVVIRSSSQTDRAGVQTASGPSGGCHYLLQRVGSTWKILGQSRWTHTVPYPDDATKRWPRVARPSELSEADFAEIKAALTRETRDEIRAIKVTKATPPLSVQVHTASPHVVAEGDFTLQKIGTRWHVTKKDELIH